MKCPKCGEIACKVVYTHDHANGIRRRRECLACGFRFSTLEKVDKPVLGRPKKDFLRA